MPRQPRIVIDKTDPVNLLLVERNIELERQNSDLRRENEEQRKILQFLEQALERPAVGTMNNQQVQLLSELIFQRIMGFPIKDKKEEKPA